LPEPIAATLWLRLIIHELLVDAFEERSKAKLFRAVRLNPTIHSYGNAADYVNETLRPPKDMLSAFN